MTDGRRPDQTLSEIGQGRAVEAHRSALIASVFDGDFDGASAALDALAAIARTSGTAADGQQLEACTLFLRDQRRAAARKEAYGAFFIDSRRGGRWSPGRRSNLEYFAREDRCQDLFSEAYELARTIERYSFNPGAAQALLATLSRHVTRISTAAHAQTPPLLILSDSHSRYFEWLVYDALVPQTVAGVCSVSQANLYGLFAPSRAVPTRARFHEALDAFPASTTVVLHIGEVDCRAIFWNLKHRVRIGRARFLDTLTRNLDRLLEEIQAKAPRVVLTCPIHPHYRIRPDDPDNPAGALAPVDGADVHALTVALGERMATVAEARGLPFVSINETVADFGGGLDTPFYRVVPTSAKRTHHFYPPKVAGFWSRALAPHLG